MKRLVWLLILCHSIIWAESLPKTTPQEDRSPARVEAPERKLAADRSGLLDAYVSKEVGNFTLTKTSRDAGYFDADVADALLASYSSPNGNKVAYAMASLISNQQKHMDELIKGTGL